jgi:hypothetical protein
MYYANQLRPLLGPPFVQICEFLFSIELILSLYLGSL